MHIYIVSRQDKKCRSWNLVHNDRYPEKNIKVLYFICINSHSIFSGEIGKIIILKSPGKKIVILS